MVRYLKLYNKFLKQYIKTLMEYRADFLLGLIGFVLVQGVGIVFISLVFNSIPKFINVSAINLEVLNSPYSTSVYMCILCLIYTIFHKIHHINC